MINIYQYCNDSFYISVQHQSVFNNKSQHGLWLVRETYTGYQWFMIRVWVTEVFSTLFIAYTASILVQTDLGSWHLCYQSQLSVPLVKSCISRKFINHLSHQVLLFIHQWDLLYSLYPWMCLCRKRAVHYDNITGCVRHIAFCLGQM